MTNLVQILQNLKTAGYRLTRARKLIISTLLESKVPLSAVELKEELQKRNYEVDKTTVYREISFLKEQKIVREIQFGEGKKRFEIDLDDHHHHIVCIRCESVDDIILENDLNHQEKKIFELKNFKVLDHSLEFFGLCAQCQ
jgi:Fe2+ or Zn2+ uptake regulation protein